MYIFKDSWDPCVEDILCEDPGTLDYLIQTKVLSKSFCSKGISNNFKDILNKYIFIFYIVMLKILARKLDL